MSSTTTPLSFATDIRPLFRQFDIDTMKTAPPAGHRFDLSDYQQVKDRADLILKKLKSGDMPCDSNWEDDKIAKFQQWITDGKLP